MERPLGWLAGGLVFVAGFLIVERYSSHPILDLRVLSRRPVALVLVTGGLAQSVAFTIPSIAILLALYPQIPGISDGLGWSAQHNAVVGVSWNLVMFVTGLVASRSLRRTDVRLVWWAGLVVMAAGYGLAGVFHGDETELIATLSLAHLGSGLVVAAAPALVVGVVAKHDQGLGSGMLNMLVSLFGTVLNASAFAVLSAHGTVVQGTTFYQDAGYTWVFWIGALLAVGALVLSLFIPPQRGEPQDSITAS